MSEMKLHELFEQGYVFIAASYYGECELESWDEILEDYHEDDGDEWCFVSVSIDDEAREVVLFHECDE